MSRCRWSLSVAALLLSLSGCSSSVVPAAPSAGIGATAVPPQSAVPSRPSLFTGPSPSAAPAALPRNGVIVYSDAAGDIHSLDPETGKTTLLIGGPTNDLAPGFTPDGKRFVFVRVDDDMLYSANADGSDVQEFGDAKQINNWDWSPRGDRIASVQEGGGNPVITDLASGSRRVIPLAKPVKAVSWLTDDSLVIVAENDDGSAVGMWTINADGTDQQPIAAPALCCSGTTLADRGLIAWNSWESGAEGRVHILNPATGKDMLLASTDVPGVHFLDPHWSPDGKWLTAKHAIGGVEGLQLALLAADGSGSAIALGPKLRTNQGEIRSTFSPDGAKILVTYEDGSAWLFDLPAGTGGKTDWSGVIEASWQALDATP